MAPWPSGITGVESNERTPSLALPSLPTSTLTTLLVFWLESLPVIIESENILSWRRLARTTQNQTLCLRALSRRSLNSSTEGRAHSPGQPAPCPPPCGAAPVPNPQLPLPWHSSVPFPRALSLSHRAELSAAPPLPVRSCSRHQASPQLLCSALSTPRDLSSSSYVFPSRPFPTFVALLLTLSHSFMPFLYCGDQNNAGDSRDCLISDL